MTLLCVGGLTYFMMKSTTRALSTMPKFTVNSQTDFPKFTEISQTVPML